MNLQKLFQSYCAPFFYPLAQAFVLNGTLRSFIFCAPLWVFTLGATWSVRNHFFFWDTVQLGSQHAQYFYENGFSTFLLPDEMDSGHPPSFGYYLALAWVLFGKTLVVSHLAMLPFVLGIVWQAYKLGEKFLGEWQAVLFPLVLMCNPVMASQGILVSPDVVLIFFFLMALNSILDKNGKWLSVAILGLAMVSMRGMMVCAALFLFDVWYNSQKSPKFWIIAKNLPPLSILTTKPARLENFSKIPNFWKIVLRTFTPYIIGGLTAFSFLLFHYLKKGWIGYHANSEWATAFQIVDFQSFIKNIAILIWRFLDFGHLFIVFTILFLGLIPFRLIKKTQQASSGYQIFKNTKVLWVLLGISILLLTPTLLMYKGLLAHRYLLPIYVILNFLALKLVSDLKTGKLQPFLFSMIFIGLITGNLWVYPQPISTGWDSTLAHLPYYKLRNDMLRYIENKGMKRSDIGTAFPNLRPSKLVDLTNYTEGGNFSSLDFEKNKYILYSNVMNDFNKDELAILADKWQVEKRLFYPHFSGNRFMVEVILYVKK
jgi:hypothetical protein